MNLTDLVTFVALEILHRFMANGVSLSSFSPACGAVSCQQFEEVLSKWDRGNKGGLSFRDIWEMTQRTFEVNDFFGWCVSCSVAGACHTTHVRTRPTTAWCASMDMRSHQPVPPDSPTACRFAAKFEWFTTWLLAADERGILTKEAVRGALDWLLPVITKEASSGPCV
jgi:hypothetical protein